LPAIRPSTSRVEVTFWPLTARIMSPACSWLIPAAIERGSSREGVLPGQSSGYYHEYTVKTPGSSTRGARRIVTGKKVQEDYYTADHYVTFKLVKYSC